MHYIECINFSRNIYLMSNYDFGLVLGAFPGFILVLGLGIGLGLNLCL